MTRQRILTADAKKWRDAFRAAARKGSMPAGPEGTCSLRFLSLSRPYSGIVVFLIADIRFGLR
jgi:hypothetical protein